jgi:hypothetical protein
MGLANELFTIPIDQNTATSALALDDNKFYIAANLRRVVFTDSEIKADADGRFIIDLSPLGLGIKKTEVPKRVLEYRAEARRRNAIERNAIFIDRTDEHFRYFYREGDQLRIWQGEKEIIGEVETIYGKPVIKSEGLELELPYLGLPGEVAKNFEGILEQKELQKVISKLTLLLAGRSLLDDKVYYGFPIGAKISRDVWDLIKESFVFFEGNDELQGWLTSEPGHVAERLGGIPIESGA